MLALRLDGNAEDAASGRQNGTIHGEVTASTDRFGNPCGAMRFDGIDGYIEVPNSQALQAINTAFTMTCWIKPQYDLSGEESIWLTLFCKGAVPIETQENPQFRVQVMQSKYQRTFSLNTDFTEQDADYQNNPLLPDIWQFFAMVYDGSFVSAYINAVKVWGFVYTGIINPNTAPLHIGKDVPGNTEYYYGDMDEFRLYAYALSADEIQGVYNENLSAAKSKSTVSIQCPGDIMQSVDKGQCGATVRFSPPQVTSSCGPQNVVQVVGLPSGSYYPSGQNRIAFETVKSNASKAKCDFVIQVQDDEPPRIHCPNDTVIILGVNQTAIRYDYVSPDVTDNCPGIDIEMLSGRSSGSQFPVGLNRIVYRATDKAGNSSQCSFNVEIVESPNTYQAPDDKDSNSDALSDSVRFYQPLEFQTCIITALMYDDGELDQDSISIFFNGTEIVSKEMIRRKDSGPIVRHLMLNGASSDVLTVKAWNLGKISPNTLRIDFYTGYHDQKIKKLLRKTPDFFRIFHCKPGLAGAVSLKCSNTTTP